jgi:hypothetical protein
LIAKMMTSTVTTTAKNAHTAVMKKYRLSTRAAIVDACSGNSGIPGSMCALRFLDSIYGAPYACAFRASDS